MGLSKLGRSFSELIEDNREAVNEEVLKVSVDTITPNRNQPRKNFNEKTLSELSQSLEAHGLLQPILVKKTTGGYELIAGERRWRAAQMLGWKTIPVRVMDMDESQSLQAALIENIQRENLNVIDCALSYKELVVRFNLTQQQIATQVGKDRSTVANTLRILELPQKIQDHIVGGRLSMGHARALLSFSSNQQREKIAERCVNENLSVRYVEELGKELPGSSKKGKKGSKTQEDPNIADIAQKLSGRLGTRVQIKQGKSKGKLIIEYYTLDDFERIKGILLNE
jgi:ParB family chromosome partitioning protein